MRGTLLALLLLGAACSKPKPFLEQRAARPTQLVSHGASPQSFERIKPPEGFSPVAYNSGTLDLKAWLALPPGASAAAKVPAVVYFHGGFAMGASDLEDARPFFDQGFALLVPMLRAENGNPGEHELFWGELDDARAAVRWLAAREDVDASKLYTFGHSAGGVLSALLSLCPDPKVRLTGSAGGLYDESLFAALDRMPFDRSKRDETRLRVFPPNAELMLQPHVGYVGGQDTLVKRGAETAQKLGPPQLLEVMPVPGDHFTSLAAAVQRYAARIATDAAPPK